MDLKQNATKGEKVQKQLWPKRYVRKYGINNLYRYRLGAGYRLTYTIVDKDNIITSVLLDILNHTEYNKLFGYHAR